MSNDIEPINNFIQRLDKNSDIYTINRLYYGTNDINFLFYLFDISSGNNTSIKFSPTLNPEKKIIFQNDELQAELATFYNMNKDNNYPIVYNLPLRRKLKLLNINMFSYLHKYNFTDDDIKSPVTGDYYIKSQITNNFIDTNLIKMIDIGNDKLISDLFDDKLIESIAAINNIELINSKNYNLLILSILSYINNNYHKNFDGYIDISNNSNIGLLIYDCNSIFNMEYLTYKILNIPYTSLSSNVYKKNIYSNPDKTEKLIYTIINKLYKLNPIFYNGMYIGNNRVNYKWNSYLTVYDHHKFDNKIINDYILPI